MAITLSEFLKYAEPHEATPVPIEPRMRLLTIAAGAVDALSLGVVALARHTATNPRPRFFILGWNTLRWSLTFGGHVAVAVALLATALVAAVALAICTSGYREASRTWQYALPAICATAVPPLLAFTT